MNNWNYIATITDNFVGDNRLLLYLDIATEESKHQAELHKIAHELSNPDHKVSVHIFSDEYYLYEDYKNECMDVLRKYKISKILKKVAV